MLSLINTDLPIKKLSKDLVHFTNTSKFDYRSHRQWHLKVEKSRIQPHLTINLFVSQKTDTTTKHGCDMCNTKSYNQKSRVKVKN